MGRRAGRTNHAWTKARAVGQRICGKCRIVREFGDGAHARYRRERRRLFGVAYRAAKKAAR